MVIADVLMYPLRKASRLLVGNGGVGGQEWYDGGKARAKDIWGLGKKGGDSTRRER